MSTISDVISFRFGKVLATVGDGADLEILEADATVVPELTRYLDAPEAEFGLCGHETGNARGGPFSMGCVQV